ncbi:MAG: hypothetical protein ACKERG_01045 [Candidatus Hodgkinia cicadicola]
MKDLQLMCGILVKCWSNERDRWADEADCSSCKSSYWISITCDSTSLCFLLVV